MSGAILVLNAGSSSVKFSLFQSDDGDAALRSVFEGQVEGIGQPAARLVVANASGQVRTDEPLSAAEAGDHRLAIARVRAWLRDHGGIAGLAAVGHRVVHGGLLYGAPVRIDKSVMEELERLIPLAPLHQPHQLAAIRAVADAAPDLPQMACFDTAFHRTQPALAQALALPRELTEAGVRRYGFHGLSYEAIALALPALAPEVAEGRVLVAHLGNGASLCAMRGRRSVATTMGFSTLDGLVMGTRPGGLDPGVLLYLMDERGMDARALEELLYHRSGLLGVSGLSSDMRELLASSDSRAREAIDLFVYRIARELGSMAAALGGLDALVFTGGIGENAAAIRARVCVDAQWLGVRIDEAANRAGGPRISPTDSPVSAWVVRTDENRMIAQHVRALLRAL
ncbi:MAG TPA: acetate/propionate family kinase [Myxococcota bacterium]|nr:acetate/propionate family kinase [Myxococcota bacterium]